MVDRAASISAAGSSASESRYWFSRLIARLLIFSARSASATLSSHIRLEIFLGEFAMSLFLKRTRQVNLSNTLLDFTDGRAICLTRGLYGLILSLFSI